jgi:hypothetical protein
MIGIDFGQRQPLVGICLALNPMGGIANPLSHDPLFEADPSAKKWLRGATGWGGQPVAGGIP